MKRFLLTVSVFCSLIASAQNGLEQIIVEKYYISDANDSIDASSNGAVSPLRVGSTTFRVYADLLPGYSVIQLFGNANHELLISTSTDFYNDPNYGVPYFNSTSVNNTKKNTQLIDSYITIGGVAAGKVGVLKTEDTDGSIGNNQGILNNNDSQAGIPINGTGAQDGLMPGSPIALNTLGFTTEFDLFDQTPGTTFSTNNGAIAALGGMQGVTASNLVLLGQFTTNGDFSFELNLQLGTPVQGQSELYVASNPIGNELTDSSLIYSSAVIDTTLSLNNSTSAISAIEVYPNPVTNTTTINWNGVNLSGADLEVAIYSVNGQLLETKMVKSSLTDSFYTMDLSSFEKGVYLLSIKSDNQNFVKQLIKQ